LASRTSTLTSLESMWTASMRRAEMSSLRRSSERWYPAGPGGNGRLRGAPGRT
jgi:hypothetical protein